MIIVRLRGGIGNQLFQFAFGRALAIYKNQELYFDLTDFTINPQQFIERDFKLQKLTEVKVVDQEVANQFNEEYATGHATVVNDYYPKNYLVMLIQYQHLTSILLDGYFQDEIYSLWYGDEIQIELRSFLQHYMQDKHLNVEIDKDKESVCIHVRRGDYLDPKVFALHGICDISYYKNAINIIKSNVRNPHFYIFTDDVGAVEELFADVDVASTNVSAVINQTPSNDNDLIEMALMSQCKHFIIANSSFSWWGSYLSDWPSTIVIAPKDWFQDESYRTKSDHIGRPSWIRI